MTEPEKQATGGGEDGFVAEILAHQGALHAYINSLLPGDPEVSDIVQNANLVLWKKRTEFEPGTNFRAWAFSVAYWEVRTWLTKRRRKSWLLFDEELVERITDRFLSDPQPGSRGEPDGLDALRFCLAKLRDSDRLLLINHYQHGKSVEECSRFTSCSKDALRMAIFRLRAALRRCIKSQLALEQARS